MIINSALLGAPSESALGKNLAKNNLPECVGILGSIPTLTAKVIGGKCDEKRKQLSRHI